MSQRGSDAIACCLACQHLSLGYNASMKRLAAARKEKGLTQQALADAVGVTQVAVANWEHGRRSPSIANLRKVADALGIPVAKLLD